MKKYLLIIVFSGAALLPGAAQKSGKLEQVAPEMAGFSSERLKRIDETINGWVQKGWMQGGEVLIARNSKIVYYPGE